MESKVYINHGRVIVDCPYGCNNAYRVEPKQTRQVCRTKQGGGCHVEFSVVMPDNLSELMKELSNRHDVKNRNWFPEDHPMAVRAKLPMGQSVSDLRAEHEMMRGKLWRGLLR